MARDILTDEQWERLRPLLPPQKPPTGRPSKDHRTIVVNAILGLDRTGAPWRELPPEYYGPWRTVATRFYAPSGKSGRSEPRTTGGTSATTGGRREGELDRRACTPRGRDGVIRAHQHAAGAPKRGMPLAQR